MTRDNIIAELKAGGSCLTAEELASLPLADLILARDAMSEPDEFELDRSSKPLVSWQVERPSRSVTPKPEKRQQNRDEANQRIIERAIGQASSGTLNRSYQARVRHQGAQVYLGVYRTKEEADEAVFRFKMGIPSMD